MALVWIVVPLLVVGACIVGALRLRARGNREATGIVLEVTALVSMAGVFVASVVAPIVRLVDRTSVASHQAGRLTWQVDGLPVTLSDAGVAAVYQPGRTPADGQTLIPGASLTDTQTTAVATFDHPGWADVMATTGSTVIGGLIVVAAVFFLWRVVRTVRRGDPFDPANVARLYTVGCLFLAGAAFSWVSSLFTFGALADLSDYADWSVELGFTQLVLGLVVVLVAEVFRQGITLRRDTEGLV